MALKAGIVGLPNVGKSTLFNCLSSAKAQAANFPFCTIDAQMGQVSVPDERLTKLCILDGLFPLCVILLISQVWSKVQVKVRGLAISSLEIFASAMLSSMSYVALIMEILFM